MLSNMSVIESFVMGKAANNTNLRTDGTRLVNYYTTIAQRIGNKMVFNATKYSVSTSKIQTWTRGKIGQCTIVEGVPMGTIDLQRYVK